MIQHTIVQDLFCVPVAVGIERISNAEPVLYLVEAEAISRSVPARRKEFAIGRACARVALGRLGCPPIPIPVNKDRTPRWPPGFVGSISHSKHYCCAVAAHSKTADALGIDLEEAIPLDSDLTNFVCSEQELKNLSTVDLAPNIDGPKLIFSAKEAFYKAVYPLIQEVLEFRDVVVALEADDGGSSGGFQVCGAGKGYDDNLLFGRIVGRWVCNGGSFYCGAVAPNPMFTRTI